MRIWWCQEHEVSTRQVDECLFIEMGGKSLVPCRMVPMRLIPDNAETVERIGRAIALGLLDLADAIDLNGKWAKEQNNLLAAAVLAALDGETP